MMLNIPWTNPRFVFYPDTYEDNRFIHIATPEWVQRPDSLFQCNGATLCGAGASRNKSDGIGYHRAGQRRGNALQPQYLDAPPDGLQVCKQCLTHLEREYLPFVE